MAIVLTNVTNDNEMKRNEKKKNKNNGAHNDEHRFLFTL